MTGGSGRFRTFIDGFTRLAATGREAEILDRGKVLLGALLAHDDWLPDCFSRPAGPGYSQFLLHLDPASRFCVVAFVWHAGEGTPIHDHTVWGLVGVLRGSETAQQFEIDGQGRPVPQGEPLTMMPGDVEVLSPSQGDVHRVRNACHDRISISIHVYGGDIAKIERSSYSSDGNSEPFMSRYAEPEG